MFLVSAASAFGGETDNRAILEHRGVVLKDGQIVVSDSPTTFSLLFSLVLAEYAPFLHAGILSIENGRPMVYEAVGKYQVWRTGAPTAATKGQISRSNLDQYLARQHHLEFYDPPNGVDPSVLARFARESFENEVAFDPFFSLDDDSYYCAEFVARGLAASGGELPFPAPSSRNRSIEVVLDWLQVEDRAFFTTASLVSPERYSSHLTEYPSRSALHAYMAAKAEIHRRFSDDQKLGNLFVLKGKSVSVRPRIRAFFDEVMSFFPAEEVPLPQERIEAIVDRLSREQLGPYPRG